MNTLSPFTKPHITSRYRQLPVLGPVFDKALTWLRHQGYAESTIRNRLSQIRRLVRWLQLRRGSTLKGLTQDDLFLAYKHFQPGDPYLAAATHLLARFFREEQMIPEGKPVPPSASERELTIHEVYLREIRGLAASSIRRHMLHLRCFLRFLKFDRRSSVISELQLDQIEAFLCRMARTNNRHSLQQVVVALRGFLRHQHSQGILKRSLHEQIDRPRVYRKERPPRSLHWEQVVALLRSIDRTEPDDDRDFTLLYLAAHYGLRSGELIRLTLDDIHWRARILHIEQTKTKQTLSLPLTDEAGDILAHYLKFSRPQSSFREVFLRRRVPWGPLTSCAVNHVLQRAIRGSELELPLCSSHTLRHSLAVHLLRGGVTLETIGKMLGHRSPESTTVYLGLSIEDLREVGLPVPTGGEPVVLPPKSRKNKQPCVGHQVTKPLAKAHFHSPLASSLRRYLAIRRALGRSYIDVEATLRYWDDFLQHRFPKARLIRSEMLQGWDQTMSQVSPTTRRQRLQIVRNFLLFHARQHPETHIPDLTTFPKPVPQRPPRLVSAEEMANVLATVSNWPASPANPLRSETIRLAFILLFCCGLRRGELVRLQWRHIDIQKGILHIEASKFHKSRLVPMSKSVTKELGEYWALRCRREKAVQPENYLIWSNHHLANKQVYCAHSIGNNWRQLCRAMEITDGRGRPPRLHDIRHSCAVGILERWYRLGYDINAKLPYLATYLGHVNPASTYYYIHFTPELQQAACRRFHNCAVRIFARGGAR